MKAYLQKILLLLVGFLGCTIASAQVSYDTSFKKEGEIGFFVGPIVEASNIGFDTHLFIGGHAALSFGNMFIGTYALATPKFTVVDKLDNQFDISLAYGGTWLSYSPIVEFPLHPYFGFKTAWGTVDVKGNLQATKNHIYVLQPEFGMSVIAHKNGRLILTGGYKWINKLERIDLVEKEDTHGLILSLVLQVGRF